MSDLKNRAQFLRERLAAAGVRDYVFTVSESEMRELNTERENFSLYRTIFSDDASVKVLIDSRKGTASGNDLSDEGLQELVDSSRSAAESSPADEGNVLAEDQGKDTFVSGCPEADMDRFYERLREAIADVRKEYPKIRLMQIIARHQVTRSLYISSAGTEFGSVDGAYSVMLEFAGNDGDKTTGLGYGFAVMHDLDRPLLDLGSIRMKLEAAEKSLETVSIGEKFEGTVLFTPDAAGDFTSMLTGNFISDSVVLDGTSLWLGRLGEKTVSDKITLRLQAQDDRIVLLDPYTADGYRAENITVFDHGTLNSFLIGLYTAKKTGRPVTRNTGGAFVMEPGTTPVKDIIRSIRRGLIVGGFSGGQPGTNGEFSGVAKNSFYIENGEVKGAVMETMISGNLQDVFRNITALSSELVSDGTCAFPYMAAEGITISGSV